MEVKSPYIVPGLMVNEVFIREIVAKAFCIPVEKLDEKSRYAHIVTPRMLSLALTTALYYRCERKTKYLHTARKYDMSHATVMHACKTVYNRLITDRVYTQKAKPVLLKCGFRVDDLNPERYILDTTNFLKAKSYNNIKN